MCLGCEPDRTPSGDVPPGNAVPARHSPRGPLSAASMAYVPGATIESVDPHGEHTTVAVRPFYLDKMEVTVAAYRDCILAGGCVPRWSILVDGCNLAATSGDNHPVNCTTRSDAEQFCRWVGKRLPTMAEWQLAAGGAKRRPQPWGHAPEQPGQTCRNNKETCEVGRHRAGATPNGIHDLAGNVWEITSEVCVVVPPRAGMCGDHTTAVHGGGWSDCHGKVTCPPSEAAHLVSTIDRVPAQAVGFRCARSAR
jgi:formylglycine-generating enzyme required for sulfatase activity